jgi:hypothetical protein
VDEIDMGRIFAAAAQVVRQRLEQRGEIGADEPMTPTQEQVIAVIEWSDLRQLKLLRKLAEGLIDDKMAVH